MQEYYNKGIKDIIDEFPQVEKILDEYGIGCGPCNVGTCLLKDIVEIHNLSSQDEAVLFSKIAKVIYPDRDIKIPEVKRKEKPKEITYSPPINKLVQEHKIIKRWAALIPEVIANLNLDSEAGREIIVKGIDFIKNYADKYHHAKEEDILFKYFDENLDIIKAMHTDHDTARAYVKNVLIGIEERDENKVSENLSAYRELLIEHIKKEDEILYPWMDRTFSVTVVGELFAKFAEVDKQFSDNPKKQEEFICELETKFGSKEVKK